jgi:hypothetical protein
MEFSCPKLICLVRPRGASSNDCEIDKELDDLNQSQYDGNWQPSAISKINGFDIDDFLDEFAATNAIGTLEPHGDFNQLMRTPAQDIQSIYSIWSGGATFYPGDNLTYILENGTEVDTNWIAIYNYPTDTGALETGGDFYNFFVLGVSCL